MKSYNLTGEGTYMEIGNIIKQNREGRKMSQTDLANKLFISRQAISKWENGSSLPSLENIIAISNILEVSLDELIKGDKRVMEKIQNESKSHTISKVLLPAIVIAMIMSKFLTNILNIPEETISYWVQPMELASIIVLLISLDFKNLKKAFNKVSYVSLMILIICYFIPSIYDFMRGFWMGITGR